MFGLSHCLELARRAGQWISRTAINTTGGGPRSQRDSSRGESLAIEELESRRMLTLLGKPIFPADNSWNQNISTAPVATNSAAIIAHIGTGIALHPDWGNHNPANGTAALYGIPVNIVNGNTTAKINVIIDNYPGESDIQGVPIPSNAIIEGDYQGGPNPNGPGGETGQRGDSHLIVWDSYNNIAYELFGVARPSDPKLYPNTSGVELPHTDNKWHAAQESVWDMNTNTFRTLGDTSADAAGLSILAGLARPDEGSTANGGQGAINHALRVTLPSGDINPQYIYPASHVVSVSSSSVKLPFGARLRLANTTAVNTLINNMPPQSQVIARAMQQYGLIVADIGSAMYITGSSATMDANNAIAQTWNMSDILASNGLTKLHAGDFEVVDLTPVVTGFGSTTAVPGSTLTIMGKNFGGAAKRLSVLFGATVVSPANVNVLNDMQISVVVPNFTGTVHVRVQSGINLTDPNNPNNNVKNPIWGYGLSAATAMDQLTASTLTPGDLNQDNVVGPADIRVQLQALANPAAYLSTYHLTAAQMTTVGDVNHDGNFNNRDIQSLLNAIASGGGSGGASSAATESGGSVITAPATAASSAGDSSLPGTLSKPFKAKAPAIYGPAVAIRVESHAGAKLIDVSPPLGETKKSAGSLSGANAVWNTYNSLCPIEFPTRRGAQLTTSGVDHPNQHEALADLAAETFDAIDSKLSE